MLFGIAWDYFVHYLRTYLLMFLLLYVILIKLYTFTELSAPILWSLYALLSEIHDGVIKTRKPQDYSLNI